MSDDTATISIDGASRGNPGAAAYAFVIERPGLPTIEEAAAIGTKTNNVAEYTALIRALEKAQALHLRRLQIRSDSELLVKQINGEYRVKNEHLRDLFERARCLIDSFQDVQVSHVRREQNRRADELCNEVLDAVGRSPSAAPIRPNNERSSTISESGVAPSSDSSTSPPSSSTPSPSSSSSRFLASSSPGSSGPSFRSCLPQPIPPAPAPTLPSSHRSPPIASTHLPPSSSRLAGTLEPASAASAASSACSGLPPPPGSSESSSEASGGERSASSKVRSIDEERVRMACLECLRAAQAAWSQADPSLSVEMVWDQILGILHEAGILPTRN